MSVYRELGRVPVDRVRLKAALEDLLLFLSSPEGRTNATCWVVDHVFLLREGWEVDTWHVPEDFRGVIEDFGGALHDAVEAPRIAEDVDSTPQQLLERVWSIVT